MVLSGGIDGVPSAAEERKAGSADRDGLELREWAGGAYQQLRVAMAGMKTCCCRRVKSQEPKSDRFVFERSPRRI